MRRLAAIFLVLTSCGDYSVGRLNDVTVRRYEDVNGKPQTNPDALGFTYIAPERSSAKHGAPEFNVMINEELRYDSNPLRMRNVIVHEFANVIVLSHGYPAGVDDSWFLVDGDTKDDAMMSFFEATWFAQHGPYYVHVSDEWLDVAVGDAIDFVDFAAAQPVFQRR